MLLKFCPTASLFIQSVFFILISGLTVPRSKQWFYDDTFQCAAFSDLAWVLFNASSLMVLYFFAQPAFLLLLFLVFPLLVMVITMKSSVWFPVRLLSLYSLIVYLGLYMPFMRAGDPFHSVSANIHSIASMKYSGAVFFSVNCICLSYLIYTRWMRYRLNMDDA